MSGPLVLLGPQRPRPNAPEALARSVEGSSHAGDGPIVVLAAGWRADETDDEPLRRHLGNDVAVLPVYTWFEVVMRELPELRNDYRARQDELALLRRLHRQRLHPNLQVVRELLQATPATTPGAQPGRDDALVAEALSQALEDLRRIDLQLEESATRIVRVHDRATNPWLANDVVSRLTHRAHEVLRSARAVVLTGGHVAVLLNRLQFFGVGAVLRELHDRGTPILAWSAGSMVLTDRIVLFYDDPPDGPAYPEILDRGLGLVNDLVLLPHARKRLRLDDPLRVGLLATRFAPAVCIGLENGAWLDRDGDRYTNRGAPGTAVQLHPDGSVVPLPQAEEAP